MYTDFHTHILPGVDDGSKEIYVSLKMIEQAYLSGTRKIWITPHFSHRYCKNSEEIKGIYNKLNKIVIKEYIDLELFLGSEIFYRQGVVDEIKSGRALTMADSRYVLVEFDINSSILEIKNALNEFILNGYYPIIAHIERYVNLFGKVNVIKELISMGAYVQVNISAFSGTFFSKKLKFANMLFDNKCIHFLGSDAHDLDIRNTDMAKGIKKIEKKYGRERLEKIFIENHNKICENSII